MNPKVAEEAMRKALTTDVPYNCKVTVKGGHAGSGWCMKDLTPELMGAIKKAGADFYEGNEAKSYGMGGSIPFLSELGEMYPTTQIVAFGVLGPNSNAHGPNELINLTYGISLIIKLFKETFIKTFFNIKLNCIITGCNCFNIPINIIVRLDTFNVIKIH